MLYKILTAALVNCNACHYEGLAVVLAISYGQTDPINQPARQDYGDYLIQNALMWFRDFHVDGLRLDDVHTIPDSEQLLSAIREQTNALTTQTGRQHYLLIEQDMTLVPAGASRLDRKTGNREAQPRKPTGRNCNGYYVDFNRKRHQTKLYRKDCLCDNTFSAILQELFERESDTASDEACMTVLQTYHQPDSTEQDEQPNQLMVSPCIPTLFMGEEWGVTSPSRTLSHDKSVLISLEGERVGFTENSQELLPTLPWEMLDEVPNQTLYRYYQSLTALRRQQPALYHLNPKRARVIYKEGDSTLLLHFT